jgi:2-methylcitrate dehydratase PrpD
VADATLPTDVNQSDVARQLAQFVVSLRFDDLPPGAVEKAKEIVLNTCGVQLATAELPWSENAYRFARTQGGPAESTVAYYGWKTSMANATFVNACFAHGFELDDNHHRSAIKGGSVVVPAALAVAEREASSGPAMIRALVAGYEVMIRVALAARQGIKQRGNHPTGTTGAIGAAAVTGSLLGLDVETMTNAVSIAAGQTGGYAEVPAKGRGDLKRTFPGSAAFHGVRAALLAQAGMTAAQTTLDPGFGFARSFGVTPESTAAVLPGLGRDWEVQQCHFKVYAQDGYIQPVTQALEEIRHEQAFSVEDIAEIRVGTSRRAYEEIIGPIRDPKTITDAQFSANFSAALYLVTGGAGIDEYTAANLNDPLIRALSELVTVGVDDHIEQEFQRRSPRGARVSIILNSGREYSKYVDDLRQMTPEELDAKFIHLASRAMAAARVETLLNDIRGLEKSPDVSELARSLVRNAPSAQGGGRD